MLPNDYDSSVMRLLLGRRKPKFRKQDSARRNNWTEIEGDDALETDFQHLLWTFGERFQTIEDARLAEFQWGGHNISYDDLARWMEQGATIHDRRLLSDLADAGITPSCTG